MSFGFEMVETYTKSPAHEANTPEADKSMSVPMAKVRVDNPALGPVYAALSKFGKPTEPVEHEEDGEHEAEEQEHETQENKFLEIIYMLVRFLCRGQESEGISDAKE